MSNCPTTLFAISIQQALKCTHICVERKSGTRFGGRGGILSTSDLVSNLDLPIIGSLAYYNSASDLAKKAYPTNKT
uniref:Uncharacterized protein n=1 Tax=Timema douglasi TaxID=61478 RepID=A0A7R8Z4I0_TIMDO|nr:unnamed protein product [Timema douglasi]